MKNIFDAQSARVRRRRIYLALLLFPSVLFIFVFRIIPLPYTIYLSFTSYNLLRGTAPYVGIQNYIKMLTDVRFIFAMGRTFLFVIVATSIELLLATGLAFLFNKDVKGKGVFTTGIVMPMFIAPVCVGTIWYIIFHPKFGFFSPLLGLFGVQNFQMLLTPTLAFLSIIIADVWQWTPFVFVIVLAGLQTIDPQLYEAAKVDGASSPSILWRITLPLLTSTILVAMTLRMMDAFRIFGKIYIMTGGGPGISTEMAGFLVWQTGFSQFRLGYSSAMVVFYLGVFSFIYYFLIKKILWSG